PASDDVVVDSGAVFTEVLGPLGHHGGPTSTYLLREEGPAIDAATCEDTEGQPVTLDQRRYVRVSPCDIGAYEFGAVPTAAEGPADAGSPVSLSLAGPNPVASSTVLALHLAQSGSIRVAVYDALGREVALLRSGELPAGRHPVAFDGSALPPGVYFVRAEAAGAAVTRALTVLR
ncbi:MAG TPA: T9SS type A sorting domain-containing protein, partial [Rubricoccaceae bacterium]|nr:T9SS type A sorting domain-containing protein [Rubricoccaceae bacterium]